MHFPVIVQNYTEIERLGINLKNYLLEFLTSLNNVTKNEYPLILIR